MSDERKNYNIIQTVASGGTAVLYKAVQVSLDRVVAVKRLHQHLTQDDNFTRRFVLEAKAAASLDHENIVRVIDFGLDDGCYQMVMEFVEGESLKDVLERWRPLHSDFALAIVHQVLRGLEHAHAKGIVHRDIKPGNIMLTRTGVAKITDFGLAKLTQGNTVQTAADSILGTPLYMSPEQAFGESVDQRSDLFSLGTVLYELVTGRQPFASENYMGVIQNIIHADVPPVRELNPEVPPEVEAIVSKALAKNREERFQSAPEFRRAIEEVLGLEGLTHACAGLPSLLDKYAMTRVLPTPAPSPRATGSAAGARKRTSSSPARAKSRSGGGIWFALIVLAVALGGAGAWFYWPRGGSNASTRSEPVHEVQSATMAETGMNFGETPISGPLPVDTTTVAAHDSVPSAPATDNAAAGPASPPAMPWRAEEAPAKTATADTTAAPVEKPQLPPPAAPQKAEPEPKPVPERTREGFLTLDVDPSADVYVNGEYRGEASPVLRLKLPAGRQSVECRYPKHESYTESIMIVPGELSRRTIVLKQVKGIISLATQEGAEFYVDGVLVGITPILKPIEVPVGTHALMIKRDGYFTWTSEVTIEANATLPLHITLSRRY